jgi:hypothetical protein
MKAQAAPKAPAPTMAKGSASSQCGHGRARQTRVTPMPPSAAWPSPPMLNSPAWKAMATARPVKTKVVA